MSFKEKSSWIVLVGMLALFGWYGWNYYVTGGFDAATGGVILVGTIAFIILVVIGHIVIAVLQAIATGKDDIDDSSDERDRSIELRGERAGGLILGLAVLATLGFCLISQQYRIASMLFMAMVLSEIVKNAWQVVLYRLSA
ncbi:hypothetical protein [Aquisalinus flavus]|uniref:Uncharacterized protein n=1 Tax=Aquisalinus flavus TaxID=1526572 RepID=A0A8J2V2J9_9PROT|nr:hypothetical protein [Aquisalinus flavus]MBD0427476.1 hypothetical protein [Aquisalinus flavus]UNE47273.1 hypothetical protein FF099_03970 [Aquisalinus flavus]GGD01293.1 hypothetical protein GCM10011342_07890 [Aquisalinus flavus]